MKLIQILLAIVAAFSFTNCYGPCGYPQAYGYRGGNMGYSNGGGYNSGYGGGQRIITQRVNTGYSNGGGYYSGQQSFGRPSYQNGTGYNFNGQPSIHRQPSPIYPLNNGTGMIGGGYSDGFNPNTGGYSR